MGKGRDRRKRKKEKRERGRAPTAPASPPAAASRPRSALPDHSRRAVQAASALWDEPTR